MEITLLGTGCPIVDPTRLGPAQLVVAGAATLLVDCGSGATQRLVAAGKTGRDLDAVLLTHLHSDHVVDLFQLVTTSWQQGRDRPMRVLGPPGTRRFVDGLLALWAPELEGRKAHERRASDVALQVEVTEFGAGEVLRLDDVRVEAVEVDHRPVEHAYAFVVSGDGKRVVFSGDTTYCPALVEAAADADLLVHEVVVHVDFQPVPGRRSAETIANVTRYHTRSDVVGRVAAEARARCLALTHFVPTRFDKCALMDEVRRAYAGPLLVGEDLMRIDVARGTVEHAGAVLGWGAGA